MRHGGEDDDDGDNNIMRFPSWFDSSSFWVFLFCNAPKPKTRGHGQIIKEREKETRVVLRGPIRECRSKVESYMDS